MTQGQAAQFTGVRAWQERAPVSGSLVYDGKIGEAKGQGGREVAEKKERAGGEEEIVKERTHKPVWIKHPAGLTVGMRACQHGKFTT